MKPEPQRPAIEIIAEWIAAASLGAAVAFAMARLSALGVPAAGGIGLGVALAALLAQLRLGRREDAARERFEPVDFPTGIEAGADAPGGDAIDDELLLDDPLPTIEESRVVRLFGAEPASAGTIPAPGEMLARIEDFLGTPRGGAWAGEVAQPVAATGNQASAEASAALHAALADIRRSLRQG